MSKTDPAGAATRSSEARPAATPGAPAPASALPAGRPVDQAVREALAQVRGALDARGVSVDLRVGPTALSPRVPSQSVTRAMAGLLEGLATVSAPGAVLQIKAERKPVLLKGKDGSEVKRDFLMLATAHAGVIPADQQQRALQGGDPGPIGLACRAVKELGGFVRFAPLPGGGLETRFFLPAT